MKTHRAFHSLLLLLLTAACGGNSDGETGSADDSVDGTDDDTAAASEWADTTYQLQIDRTQWSEPPSIGNDIGDFVPEFLIAVGAASGDSYDVMIGTAKDGEQFACNPTSTTTITSDEPPAMQLGPVDFPVFLEHVREDIAVNATIYELTMTNLLPDGGTPAEEGELTAIMDVRELYQMFTLLPEPSADAVCAALDSFNAPCERCPSDDVEYCLALKAVRLGASESSLSVSPIAAADVTAEECQPRNNPAGGPADDAGADG